MIALTEVREALAVALRTLELNVSDGGDLVPNGAVIGPFVCNYHASIAGASRGGMVVAGCEVRVVTDRADEQSANGRQDAALTYVWDVLERATGPWHSIIVQTGRPDAPLVIGESSYAAVAFVIEFYV